MPITPRVIWKNLMFILGRRSGSSSFRNPQGSWKIYKYSYFLTKCPVHSASTHLKYSILHISLDSTPQTLLKMHFIASLLLLPALAVAAPRTLNLGLRNLGVNPGDITIVSAAASGNGW
jgi:hypothetical protein